MEKEKFYDFIQNLNEKDPREFFINFPNLIEHLKGRNDINLSEINPNNPHYNPWQRLAEYCFYRGLYDLAKIIYSEWYNKMVKKEADSTERTIHKGTPLHQLGLISQIQGRRKLAKRYFLLALVEDIFRDPVSYKNNQAYRVLRSSFRISDNEINEIKKIAEELSDKRYPEKAILEYNLNYNVKNRIRDTEREIFEINSHFASQLMKEIEEQNKSSVDKGTMFENLMVYLLSSVDGFEVAYIRKWTMGKEHDYDLIIRNLINNDPVFMEFGKYILVECKYWNKPVGVNDIHHFISKIRNHDCHCGILVAKEGISHTKEENLSILKAYHRDGIVVIVITKNDIENVIKGDINLITLLLSEYEKIKFDMVRNK